MARIIAICNQKGGVGKTTTTVNLGAYLALLGKRTLVLDFDPQANASSALGSNPMTVEKSVYHGILGEAEPHEIIRPSQLANLHVAPAAPHLAGALIELVDLPGRESYLRSFLHRVRHLYDYVLIDLPPSLSLLTVNGLMAADEAIVPVQAEYYSLEGIGQLLSTLSLINDNLGHPIRVSGALLTMYDRRERLSQEIKRNLKMNFPYPVYETHIPRSVVLAEAPSFGKPVALYRPDAPGALAYAKLANEVVAQEKQIIPAVASSENFGNFNVNLQR